MRPLIATTRSSPTGDTAVVEPESWLGIDTGVQLVPVFESQTTGPE